MSLRPSRLAACCLVLALPLQAQRPEAAPGPEQPTWAAVASTLAGPSSIAAPGLGRPLPAPFGTLSAFASAVTVVGDEIYVGRPGEVAAFPMPANRAGAVHVFAREAVTGEWRERQAVSAAGGRIGDMFGASLAVAGNVLVVGAPKAEGGRGAAYVFERTGAGEPWVEAGSVPVTGTGATDAVGAAVAVSGEAVLVAAPGRNGGSGVVLVYRRGAPGRGWTAAGELRASDGSPDGRFGTAISASGDRVAVGAPGGMPSLLPSGAPPVILPGAAYVFDRTGDGWTETARLQPQGSGPALMGMAVNLSGDDLLVGAPFANRFNGHVVHFRRNASTAAWDRSGTLAPAAPQPQSGFGMSIARAGSDVLVGAPLAGGGVGAAYVLRRDGTGAWTEVQQFGEGRPFGFYGSAVAAGADLAVIGSPGEDFFEGTGHLIVKDPASGAWTEVAALMDDSGGMESVVGAEVGCENGEARAFSCSEVDLVAFLPNQALGAGRGVIVNDLWGWTDPETGREYAIVGRADATAFVDLGDPANPVYLGELPLHDGATPNMWRDIKVYRDHAFIVADGAGPHGVQVFDLRRLRDVRNAPETFEETAHYDGIASAHNIVVNEDTGFAYVVGASGGGSTCGGGLHMIDIRNPLNPTFAGCFSDPTTGLAGTGYSHDAQCIAYHGPDPDHQGKEVCLGANENALSISDVTDKGNPVAVSKATYPNSAYLHQGWVSPDHRWFYMNDELDELAGGAPKTRTLVWDIEDLDDPILAKEHLGTTEASDHNLYVRDNLMYQSNYVSGLRILDITDPVNPVEVGYFDTVPFGDDSPGFAGSWSNYPYFASGLIIVSSMREGLFVLKKRPGTVF